MAKAIVTVPASLSGPAAEYFNQAIMDRVAAGSAAKDPDVDDSRICFSVQQAIEKTIKAVTYHRGGRVLMKGHPMNTILKGLRSTGVAIPKPLLDVIRLEPCAVSLRYRDEIPGQLEVPFDRQDLIDLADEFMRWAVTLV